jgi:hypothetical protein
MRFMGPPDFNYFVLNLKIPQILDNYTAGNMLVRYFLKVTAVIVKF